MGVIGLFKASPSRHYKHDDLQLIEELAQRSSIAMNNARLYREAQRAKLIADNLPAMISYWDRDERCLFANHTYLEVFENQPENLYGYTMLELLGPELYEKNRPFIQAAFRGEKQTFEIDIPFKSSGDIRHTNTTFVPEISHNQVNGFFAMVMDVTELKDAQLKALEAVRTREDVLAIVSHDLKNPLTTMGLISDMLDKVDDLSKVHIFSKKIKNSVDRMHQLVGDLLDFAKIESGTFSVDLHAAQLSEVIHPILDGTKLLVESKNLTLNTNIPDQLPEIAVDINRLGQAFTNLLSNAIKFTPQNGSITISVQPLENEVQVAITDTGPGISDENLHRVFDRFWQAKNTKKLGSGLGLSIAKGIIDAHGGKIWVESQLGQGSTFKFTVPRTTSTLKRRDSASPAQHLFQNPTHNQSLPLFGIHVLLVDDSQDLLNLLNIILENAGARVSTATSVQEALQKFSQQKPDVLVTDIEMPDEDGYELIDKIHHMTPAEGRNTPIAAMTAHSQERDRQKIALAGFDTYLTKPIQIDKTVEAIKSLANKSHLLH